MNQGKYTIAAFMVANAARAAFIAKDRATYALMAFILAVGFVVATAIEDYFESK